MHLFQDIVTWYMAHINYWTVALLMTIESSFIPFPSEVVVPPAAYLVAQGKLHWAGVMGAASVGAMSGALINYFLALKLGRTVLYRLADTRIAHALLITKENLEKSESYFRKHGKVSTLIGRLLPGIRQLISIPAGLARMDFKPFLLFTFIGASLWNIVLFVLGYFMYSQKELMEKYYGELSMAMVGLGVLFALYLLWNGLRRKKTV